MFPAGDPAYRVSMLTLRSRECVRIVETGPADGAPVFCIAGWACSVWDFHRTLPALAAAGFRAIAVDLRGQGLSDKPEDEQLYTAEAFAAQAHEVLERLRLERPAIVGHSMGGAIAFGLALRSPERFRAVAMISPVGFGDIPVARVGCMLSPPWAIHPLRWLLRRSAVGIALRVLYTNDECVNARNVDEYWAPSQFPAFVPAQRAALHRFRWTPFTGGELAAVKTPCLLLRGARDPVVRAPGARRDLPGAFREIVIEDAGHLPHDEAPEVAHAALIGFLAGSSR
jgi:pimeloyl-ACP methyl ester carboxylesterase